MADASKQGMLLEFLTEHTKDFASEYILHNLPEEFFKIGTDALTHYCRLSHMYNDECFAVISRMFPDKAESLEEIRVMLHFQSRIRQFVENFSPMHRDMNYRAMIAILTPQKRAMIATVLKRRKNQLSKLFEVNEQNEAVVSPELASHPLFGMF